VHVGEGEVAPDEADVALTEDLADRGFGHAAVGALEVAVLDHGDAGVRRPADVVALGVDVVGQVDDLLGSTEEGLGTSVR